MTVAYESLDFLGFPDHCVGDNASVWRWQRVMCRWRKLKPWLDTAGRPQVDLCYKGKKKTYQVCHLVLYSHKRDEPRLPGTECCHNDGDCKNNVPNNLRWDTRASNMRDRDKHGRTVCGKRSPTWRHDITRRLLLDTFTRLKSSVLVAKELNIDRSSLRARLTRYGYRIVRNRAKVGYGWENYLEKVK